jgi:hypothetical protein
MRRYVGVNSEEIQAEALRVGASIGQLLGPLGLNKPRGPITLPELLALRADEVAQAQELTLREKQRRLRAQESISGHSDDQMKLFG